MSNVDDTNKYGANAPKSVPQGTRVCCHGTEGGRNLVINLDGTGNQFGDKNTNVVEMYSLIDKGEDSNQLSLYYSGIGTYARPSWTSFSYYKQVIYHKIDLAIAWEFEKTIMGAYSWLSDNYRDGDRIFLIGFSRGAFQVRALSAMIDKVGLLYKGNDMQIPFAYELYADPLSGHDQVNAVGTSDKAPQKMSKAERFKSAFCHKDVKVHFVGAWDTVSSIGLVRKKKLLPGTIDGMKHVCFFRHALALDERRVKFLPEYAYGGTTLPPKHSDPAPSTEDDEYLLYPPFLDAFLYSVVVLFSFPWSLGLLSIAYRIVALYMIFRCLRFAQDVAILEWEPLPFLTDLQLKRNPTPSCPGTFHLAVGLPDDDRGSIKSNETPLNLSRGEETNSGMTFHKTDHDEASNIEDSAHKVKDATPQSLEVWFAGTHSDIGGGNVQNEGMDRSRPPLRWMVHEAGALGLRTKAFTRELSSEEHFEVQESLTGLWRILEWLPFRRLTYDKDTAGASETYSPHRGAGRVIQPGQKIHGSLTLAKDLGKSVGYIPKARLSREILSTLNDIEDDNLKDGTFWENLGDEKFRDWLEVDLGQHVQGLLRMYISEQETQKKHVLNALKQIPTWNDGRQALYDACIQLLSTIAHIDTESERVRVARALAGKPLDEDESYRLLKVVEALLPVSRLSDVKLVQFSELRGGPGLATLLDDKDRKKDTASCILRLIKLPVDFVLRPTSTRALEVPWSIAFSADGKLLASGHADGVVWLWDVRNGSQIGAPLVGHTRTVYSVAFSPDGNHLVSGSGDRTIGLWDVEKRERVGDLWRGHTDEVACVAFSPDGSKVVSASRDKTIGLWNAKTRNRIAILEGHDNKVLSVTFSPDGRHIASGSVDETIRIWDTLACKQDGDPLKGHTHWVYSVAYSPDGKHIASGSWDNTIRSWDTEKRVQVGKPLVRHAPEEVYSVCFSPDGKLLASGSWADTIWIWNADTGEQIGDGLRGHGSSVWSLAFSPDGKTLASASRDGTIMIWDVESYVKLTLLAIG